MTTYKVMRKSSVDISDRGVEMATGMTRQQADAYVQSHSVDEHGNVSSDPECDYLDVDVDVEEE